MNYVCLMFHLGVVAWSLAIFGIGDVDAGAIDVDVEAAVVDCLICVVDGFELDEDKWGVVFKGVASDAEAAEVDSNELTFNKLLLSLRALEEVLTNSVSFENFNSSVELKRSSTSLVFTASSKQCSSFSSEKCLDNSAFIPEICFVFVWLI